MTLVEIMNDLAQSRGTCLAPSLGLIRPFKDPNIHRLSGSFVDAGAVGVLGLPLHHLLLLAVHVMTSSSSSPEQNLANMHCE